MIKDKNWVYVYTVVKDGPFNFKYKIPMCQLIARTLSARGLANYCKLR